MKPYGVPRKWNAVEDYCTKFRHTGRRWQKFSHHKARQATRKECRNYARTVSLH